jgi:hypothetical protein
LSANCSPFKRVTRITGSVLLLDGGPEGGKVTVLIGPPGSSLEPNALLTPSGVLQEIGTPVTSPAHRLVLWSSGGKEVRMLSNGDILYGVGLTAAVEAVLAVVVPRWRRPLVVVTAAAVGFLATLVWQLVLGATHASEFFTDLPFRPFPVSWQDAGSGVAAFALGALVLAYGPMRSDTPRAVTTAALAIGAVALVVDVYLY